MGPFWSNATGIGPASRVFIDRTQSAIDLGTSYRWGHRYTIDLQINNVGNDWFFLVRAEPPRSWRLSFKVDL
jgi:hypothetical protein